LSRCLGGVALLHACCAPYGCLLWGLPQQSSQQWSARRCPLLPARRACRDSIMRARAHLPVTAVWPPPSACSVQGLPGSAPAQHEQQQRVRVRAQVRGSRQARCLDETAAMLGGVHASACVHPHACKRAPCGATVLHGHTCVSFGHAGPLQRHGHIHSVVIPPPTSRDARRAFRNARLTPHACTGVCLRAERATAPTSSCCTSRPWAEAAARHWPYIGCLCCT